MTKLPVELLFKIASNINESHILLKFSQVNPIFRAIALEIITKNNNLDIGHIPEVIILSPFIRLLSKLERRCIFCSKRTTYDPFFGYPFYVCYNHQRTIETITLTVAKKEYHLTETDLQNLPQVHCRNPHRKSLTMTLFIQSQVKTLSDIIHSEDYWTGLEAKRQLKLTKNQQKETQKIARENELIELLGTTTTEKYRRRFVNSNPISKKYIETGVPQQQKRKQEMLEIIRQKLV